MTREEAINHPECPQEIKDRLVLVDVKFVNEAGEGKNGQIVVDQDLAGDVENFFEFMLEQKFPLTSVEPIAKYNWDDEASMSVNNSSGFNYRKIARENQLSNHSYGFAIDINPQINPYIKGDMTQPSNASYNVEVPGTLYSGHPVVEFMKARGWEWGGDWGDRKDYQHFAKKVYDV